MDFVWAIVCECDWPWHADFAMEDIKSLDSSREDRIKYFEKTIAELKKSAKQNVDKIEKQREKTEQAQVEVEVLRNELLQMEGQEQDSENLHVVQLVRDAMVPEIGSGASLV